MPQQLNSRCKELIAGSLIQFFELERDNNGPFLPIAADREGEAAALNLSVPTICSISQTVKERGVLKSPPKKRQ